MRIPHPISSRPPGRACAALVLLLAASPWGASAQDAPGPSILDSLELPEQAQAVALSPDGRRAALALPSGPGERAPRTLLYLHSVDATDPATIKIQGLVRDLSFSDDAGSVYVLEYRPAKRRDGEAYLLRIGIDGMEIEERLRLPPSARGIEPWPAGRALLIPAHNEIRTIALPLLRSGPLFRVPGDNLCVTVNDGTRVLVGQQSAVLVVDLSDPQGREGMPVRQTIATTAPVASIELLDGGTRAVAHLADGGRLALRLDPPTPVDAPPAEPPLPPPASPPSRARATPPIEAAVARRSVQIRGTIRDAATDLVISVVFLGPDNLLREAARIRAAPDGRWESSGLPPGRYRIQLDAGGSRALITDPPFRTIEIPEGPAPARTVDFRIAGAL